MNDNLLFGLQKMVDHEMNLMLLRLFMHKEIYDNLYGMNPTKALRVDGLLVCFF